MAVEAGVPVQRQQVQQITTTNTGDKNMELKIQTIAVQFTEPLLGSNPGNPDIHAEFIASKAPAAKLTAEEVGITRLAAYRAKEEAKPDPGAVAEAGESAEAEEADDLEKASTVFLRDETGIFLLDYVIKGTIKDMIGGLIDLNEIIGYSRYTFKRVVNNTVRVGPRRIYLRDPEGTIYKQAPSALQRPIRAETMRGERVALVRSEMVPAGTIMTFTVQLISPSTASKKKSAYLTYLPETVIYQALDYGVLRGVGFGQWRSGGYGRYKWTKADPEAVAV